MTNQILLNLFYLYGIYYIVEHIRNIVKVINGTAFTLHVRANDFVDGSSKTQAQSHLDKFSFRDKITPFIDMVWIFFGFFSPERYLFVMFQILLVLSIVFSLSFKKSDSKIEDEIEINSQSKKSDIFSVVSSVLRIAISIIILMFHFTNCFN